MNKELQDKVWLLLPKEFKEKVKKDYRIITDNAELDEAYNFALEETFGIHNLTSDAEGEDGEMLCVSRKKVQKLYKDYALEYSSNTLSPSRGTVSVDRVSLEARIALLQELFGPECFPYTTCVHSSGTSCKNYNGKEYHCNLSGECKFDPIRTGKYPNEESNSTDRIADSDKMVDNPTPNRELLTVSRKKIQELYNKLFGNPLDPVSRIQLRKDLKEIFGVSCFPEEENVSQGMCI